MAKLFQQRFGTSLAGQMGKHKHQVFQRWLTVAAVDKDSNSLAWGGNNHFWTLT